MSSKTARKNDRTSANRSHETGDAKADSIISLNDGKHAYVFHGGRTRHIATDTTEFAKAVEELNAMGLVESFAGRWPGSQWETVVAGIPSLLGSPETKEES